MINKLKYVKAVIVAAFMVSADYIKSVTKLQLLNWILQFLFIRIYYASKLENSYSSKDQKYSLVKYNKYGLLYPVVPLTGWLNDFWSLGFKLKYKIVTGWMRE